MKRNLRLALLLASALVSGLAGLGLMLALLLNLIPLQMVGVVVTLLLSLLAALLLVWADRLMLKGVVLAMETNR
jgi:hypothetical protein